MLQYSPKYTDSEKITDQLHSEFYIMALTISKITITQNNNNKTIVHPKHVHSLV